MPATGTTPRGECACVCVSRTKSSSYFNPEPSTLNTQHSTLLCGQDQYLVAHTPETLLIGDLGTCKLSEVPWSGSGSERFIFDNPSVCMVYNAGELTLVEYGRNEILGSCRTEHVSPHYISCRLNECQPAPRPDDPDGGMLPDNKKITYLMDIKTIQILDLATGQKLATIDHDSKVAWPEHAMIHSCMPTDIQDTD